MDDNNVILEVRSLVKVFKTFRAVDDLDLKVYHKEIFGILGPNGAGKTTTLEIIEGLQKPTSGEVILDGMNVQSHLDEVKSRIGVQLQSSGFFEGLNLIELLNTFAALYGKRVDAYKILDEVQLKDKAKSKVKTLSGGQKQRFSIGVALANDPKILFLDEPTTGLDPQARRNLWDIVQNLKKSGKTVVLTTHYMEEAEELCDRVAIMDNGKIIKLGTPTELVDELIASGFISKKVEKIASLEDVFLNLTGKALRE